MGFTPFNDKGTRCAAALTGSLHAGIPTTSANCQRAKRHSTRPWQSSTSSTRQRWRLPTLPMCLWTASSSSMLWHRGVAMRACQAPGGAFHQEVLTKVLIKSPTKRVTTLNLIKTIIFTTSSSEKSSSQLPHKKTKPSQLWACLRLTERILLHLLCEVLSHVPAGKAAVHSVHCRLGSATQGTACAL